MFLYTKKIKTRRINTTMKKRAERRVCGGRGGESEKILNETEEITREIGHL